MDLFAPRHLIVILLICLIVFGGKKLKTLGSDLGTAVRGFKQAMKDGESAEPVAAAPAPAAANHAHTELPAPTTTAEPATAKTSDAKAV